METNSSKKVLTWLVGFIVGIVVAVSILWLMYRANLFSNLFIEYTTYPSTPINTTSTTEVKKLGEINVLVPKSVGSKEYRDSLNDLINDYNAMAKTANDELIPALAEIGEKYKNKDFENFLDIILKAKEMNTAEKEMILQFGGDITRLKEANQTTTDPGAKALTNDLIEKVEELHENAALITDTIDKLLSSGVPTTEMFAEMRGAISSFNQKSKPFDEVAQKLFEYLAQRVKETLPQ